MNIKESPSGTIRVMAIAATAALLSLTGCGAASTEINLSDYIVFESAGYETYGTAECWFDAASYTKDIDAIFAEKDMWNESKYSQEQMELAEGLYHSYFVPIADKTSGLSNGDHVEVTTEYTADQYKDIGIRLTGGNESYEVSGLEPLKDFDPFSDLQVIFNGVSPLCTASLSGTRDDLMYTVSQDTGLSLGDTVTVEISFNGGQDFSDFTAMTGLVPTATEKSYVVENVPHYPKNIAEIPDNMKMKMDKAARDSIKNMEETDWKGIYELSGVDFLGYYYVTPKRINLYQETDYKLYMVYRIKVVFENGDPYEFYNYWCFKDISILPDGTCTCNLDDYEICKDKVRIIDATPKATRNGGSLWGTEYYRGYKSLDAIFNQQIAKYTDLYDYESTVKDGVPQSVTSSDESAQQANPGEGATVSETGSTQDETAAEETP